tara:strand:- start:2347 stop:2604 length:258 start_codon:yes stop_codon:yes gene_type:complete
MRPRNFRYGGEGYRRSLLSVLLSVHGVGVPGRALLRRVTALHPRGVVSSRGFLTQLPQLALERLSRLPLALVTVRKMYSSSPGCS